MNFSYEAASRIAEQLNCDPASVLAVAEVESGGRRDLPDGRPQILFEAHWFDKLTKGKYRAQHPRLSSPIWDRSLYVGGAGEYGRLNAAIRLDENAALQSASWGLFQIMGFNYKAAGYPTVQAFVRDIKGDDNADMRAFMAFVRSNPQMLAALQERDWKTFAQLYNGPGAVASYSGKMADAYQRHAGMHVATDQDGPPIPFAEPSQQPQSLLTSKTMITGGTGIIAGGSALATIADQASTASSIAGSVSSAAWSMSSLYRMISNPYVIVIGLMLIAMGCMGYMLWRYAKKARNGDVVIR